MEGVSWTVLLCATGVPPVFLCYYTLKCTDKPRGQHHCRVDPNKGLRCREREREREREKESLGGNLHTTCRLPLLLPMRSPRVNFYHKMYKAKFCKDK